MQTDAYAICVAAEYAGALHNMISRSMAGVVDPSTLATLLVCYAGLALAAVYISRTELRLPTLQYASVAASSEVGLCGRALEHFLLVCLRQFRGRPAIPWHSHQRTFF